MKKPSVDSKKHVKRRQIYQSKRGSSRKYSSRFLTPIYQSSRNERKVTTLKAPRIFNLQFENCIEVIEYVNDLKYAIHRKDNIVVDLSDVEDIKEGAIAMLLSVMKDAEKIGVRISGNRPNNVYARNVLNNSGFFKFVRSGRESDGPSKNLIRTGKRKTSASFLGSEVRKAMGTVWGIEGRNPLVWTAVFEMMRNSCDHAFPKSEKTWWHLSISHDDEKNLVKFSFVDNGKGIIETLGSTVLRQVLFKFKDSADVLETAFRDGIESRTGLPWRGKGLPTIFESYQDGYIKNLLVISNDAFIYFDKEIKRQLPISYEGTYYYWEVDTSCKMACFE